MTPVAASPVTVALFSGKEKDARVCVWFNIDSVKVEHSSEERSGWEASDLVPPFPSGFLSSVPFPSCVLLRQPN